jgi:hypothetical protein
MSDNDKFQTLNKQLLPDFLPTEATRKFDDDSNRRPTVLAFPA